MQKIRRRASTACQGSRLEAGMKSHKCTGFLVILTLLLLLTLLGLTIWWSHIRHQGLKPREQIVCVQCGSLSKPHPGKNDTDECCGKASLILDGLVEKSSQQKFQEREATRMLSNYGDDSCSTTWETVAVRLAGINRRAQDKENDGIIHFNDDLKASKEHFKYENGELHVMQTAHYYMSSQIKIRHTAENSDVVYHHWIHHITKDGDKKILESFKSSCESVSKLDEITLMHGAVFKLHEGDRVRAHTSHPNNLSPIDNGHSFVMYSIDSPKTDALSQSHGQ